MDYFKKYCRIALNILVPILVVLFVIYILPRIIFYFIPFVIGWIVALIANPVVRFLEKRLKIVRRHGSVLLIALVIAAVLGAIYGISVFAVHRLQGLAVIIPNLITNITNSLNSVISHSDSLQKILPDSVYKWLMDFLADPLTYFSEWVKPLGSSLISGTGSIVKEIPDIFLGAILMVLSAYFFLADREKIHRFMGIFVFTSVKYYWEKLQKRTKSLIGGYFSAQFKIMFVVFAILLLGLGLLRVPYFGLIAFLIAVLDFLPVFGTGTAMIPWCIFEVVTGNYYQALWLLLIYVAASATRQLITPKIVGDSMGLNPMLTMLFLFLGYKVAGVGGMIIAVPVGIVVLELFSYGAFDSLILNVKVLVQDINRFRKGLPISKEIELIPLSGGEKGAEKGEKQEQNTAESSDRGNPKA